MGGSRSLDAISILALFITFVAALFIFVPSMPVLFVPVKTFLLAAGALITLALYILARLARGNVIFPSSSLIGVIWLPVVAYALSATFSGTPFAGALWGTALEPDTLGFMLVVAGLGTLSALALRRPEQYRAFLRVGAYAFCALAFLQAAIIIIGRAAPNILSSSFSPIGSFDHMASLLGLGVISILITLRFVELSSRTYRALLAGGAVALFSLAIANSSLVWTLIALVSLGLFVEAVMRRGPKTVDAELDETILMDESPLESDEGNHSLVLPLATLAVALFFLIGGTLGGALAQAFNVNSTSVRPSWQSTLSVAKKTYAISPVFGSGPGTFGVEWLKYRDASLNSTVFWNVDFTSGIGFIPTSFVTTGILGVLAWFGLLALFIALGLRTLILRTPQDPFVRYVAIVSFVSALYLFSIALFDLPNATILALTFIFAGLFISTTRYAAGGRQRGIVFSRSPRLGFIIVFSLTILLLSSVVAAYSLVARSVAVTRLASANVAASSGNLALAEQNAQSSLSFVPSAAAYQIRAVIANAQLNKIATDSTMEKSAAQQAYQAALSAGIDAALTATNLNPSDYRSWLALGDLYAQAVPLNVSGAYESAKTAYEKARALNPTDPRIPYTFAQLNIAHKDTKAAQEDLKAAITLKQDYTSAIFLLSQLQVQDGNVKDALTSALAANYFTPNNPNILFQIGILSAAAGDNATAATALEAAVAANQQFANARYFLSAVYAKQGNIQKAREQMQAIADMSVDNAEAVAAQLSALGAGKNPFPANLLSLPATPVE
jgi:tetratricopeptide (TPR) repeat protein